MKKHKPDQSVSVPQRAKIEYDLSISEFPWSEKQKELIEIINDKATKFVFVLGPAGSSKTLIGVYTALKAMQARRISDIVYVRQPVESSKFNIGYLKGDIQEKLTPYAQPLEDKLGEFLIPSAIKKLKDDKRIDCVPVGHMRGRSFNAKYILVDECFAGNTYVLTERGRMTIRSLYQDYKLGKPLPKTLSYNERDQVFEYKTITEASSKGIRPVIRATLGNRKIECTPEHLFLTSLGWKPIAELKAGDAVIAYDKAHTHQVLAALNEDQKQVLLGSYLGDGSISHHGVGRIRLKVIHGMKQQGYCAWKASMFNSELSHIEKNGYAQKPAVKFCSKIFSASALGLLGITESKKSCHQKILDSLDARGLAIWFMDDGSISKTGNSAQLCTHSFDYDSQLRFVEYFAKLGVKASIREDVGSDYHYYFLGFDAEASRALVKIITPYVHPDLFYKLGGEEQTEKYSWNSCFQPWNHILFNKIESSSDKEVFDLGVEDNHNFVICAHSVNPQSGVVVHNCQNLAYEDFLLVMTRLGKHSKMIMGGDMMQPDIKNSAFQKVASLFDDEESRARGIRVFRFGKEDIFRDESLSYVIEKFECCPN